jgi:hypothetical protein
MFMGVDFRLTIFDFYHSSFYESMRLSDHRRRAVGNAVTVTVLSFPRRPA